VVNEGVERRLRKLMKEEATDDYDEDAKKRRIE
jgi:hypothetical protein